MRQDTAMLIGRPNNRLLRLRGLPFAGFHFYINIRNESRNHYRGYYPVSVLYNLLSYRNPTCLPLYLHPLEVLPTNLLEISRVIRTSSHMAKLAKKHRGTAHGASEVVKDQVLMNSGVAQLEDASLQHCLKSRHVQQGRVERNSSLVIRRSARTVVRLLLNLEPGQPYTWSNTVVHSLLDPES